MMKRLSGLLIGSLLLLSSLATLGQGVKTVCIPDSVLSKTIDELIVLDGLKFELHEKDSMLVVYSQDINNLKVQIGIYKLNEVDFNTILGKKDEEITIVKDSLKKTQRQLTWDNVKLVGLGILAFLELVVIAVVATH